MKMYWAKAYLGPWQHFLSGPQAVFFYKLDNISWKLPEMASKKNPKTSDSLNTDILPIPTSISTKTSPFELTYKGRRTRNTQVCRHKMEPIVYLSYMSSRPRPISEKWVFEPFVKGGH